MRHGELLFGALVEPESELPEHVEAGEQRQRGWDGGGEVNLSGEVPALYLQQNGAGVDRRDSANA